MRLLLAALVAVSLAACGDDGGADDGRGDGASDVPAQLDGRTLLVTSITEDGVDREPLEGTEIRLTFERGELGASAGCNSMSGRYAVDGDVLLVDELATTDMACDPARMDQDSWLAGVLGDRPTVVVDGDEVVLTAGPTTLVLADRAAVRPDAPLVGTVWVLDTILEGVGPDGAASSVPGGVEASVTFGDDGTVGIDTGCNSGSGTYAQTSDDVLELARVLTTAIGCGEPVAGVEAAMLAVLAPGEVEVTVEDRRLTLTAGDAGLGFHALS